ncbi:MAG: hypothetical protein HONBIEJF_00940 [Fimbriimonadaceae bacterium]|nr:hypothetical protein [Fimbriimonadaceae bacterium]
MSPNAKSAGFGFLGAAAFWCVAHSGPAVAQNVKEFVVRLQDATPGTSQTGHSNISGTARAGQFQGGGGGLTGVNADLLDGFNSTAFLQSIPIPLEVVGSQPLHMIRAENSYGGTAFGSAALAGYMTAASTQNPTYGVLGVNASTQGRGVLGFASSSTGSNYGLYGETLSNAGTAIFGISSHSTGAGIGVHGRVSGSSGRAVQGVASNINGSSIGGYFESFGNVGWGVVARAPRYGVDAVATGELGRAVNGWATSITGAAIGGLFTSDSTEGTGAYGHAAASSGVTYGVYGRTDSTSGRAVYGTSTANTGTNYGGRFENDSTSGRGIYALASATTGTTYGVRGEAVSNSGYGVYAVGDLGASGTKTFRIDHPLDPENRYLVHYSAESPYPQNFYVGTVVTDGKGYAWVDLPSYFSEINANFKYQLTVVDDADASLFVMAKVSKKIRGNRFQIRTSAPNTEVSWEVKADRNDLYVRTRKLKDVVDKTDAEQGKVQHPEHYGKARSEGLDNGTTEQTKRPERGRFSVPRTD